MEVTNPLPISPKSELEGDGSSPRSGDFHSTAALTKKVSQPLRKQEPNIIRIQVGESANHTFDESIMVQVKQDPFVTHETVMRSQLSPTASAFDPYARPKNIHAFENDGPIASLLSFDIGLSRSVMISSSPALSPSKIENFLSVSFKFSHLVPALLTYISNWKQRVVKLMETIVFKPLKRVFWLNLTIFETHVYSMWSQGCYKRVGRSNTYVELYYSRYVPNKR